MPGNNFGDLIDGVIPIAGIDPFGRVIVDLSMDEQDLAEAGLSEGVLRGWPEEQGRDAATKPDWCE
mgnify:CR=1 FL=1